MAVEGGDKLARKLQMIAEETSRKHMRECALEGAEVLRKEVEVLAPRKTGTLAKNIYKEIETQTKSRVEVYVGPGGKGWYGALVEEGHKVTKSVKKGSRKGARVIGYAAPNPFIRPAFDAKTNEAEKAFEDELRKRLKIYEE